MVGNVGKGRSGTGVLGGSLSGAGSGNGSGAFSGGGLLIGPAIGPGLGSGFLLPPEPRGYPPPRGPNEEVFRNLSEFLDPPPDPSDRQS